jgi:subtilase family serine protease
MNHLAKRQSLFARTSPLFGPMLLLLAVGCGPHPSADHPLSQETNDDSTETIETAHRQQLSGHITPEMASARIVGRVPNSTEMHITIGLPVRDKRALATAVAGLSDPHNPMYRHYLTPVEFGARFGASAKDYEKVLAWARSHNLNATPHPNRLGAEMSGSLADVEDALHVRFLVARRPDGTRFRVPDAEPSLDLDVPVEHVGNLDDYVVPRHAVGGSGPGGSYTGMDFRHAYAGCTTLDGTGQEVGILMLGNSGFAQRDITQYFTSLSLPVPLAVQAVPSGSGTTPDLEGTLDVTMALSMAPGAQVVGFTGPLDSALLNITKRPDVKTISSSFATLVDPSAQGYIAELALQGQAFLQASGDDGGHAFNYNYSNSDFRLLPAVTNVGGTLLIMNGNGASYGTEPAWPGSSGGVLANIPIPPYQVGLATAANGGSAIFRNMPDVAADAVNVSIVYNGAPFLTGGTSASAPLWAGFMALVNQQLAASGKPSIAPLNPALYAAAQATYSTAFNDITISSNGLFNATPGYDLVTGLGSPQCGLIAALASITPPLGCVVGSSCAQITGYAPPELTVGCGGTLVDFYHQYPAGERTFLGTETSYTEGMNDYDAFLVACAHGTSECTSYSEFAPVTEWCNRTVTGGGGGHCKEPDCCHGICQ